MTTAVRSPSLPFGPIVINAVGALLLLAGATGLFVPGIAQSVPALTDPATAWTLLASGAVLDAWSCLTIVQLLRRKPR